MALRKRGLARSILGIDRRPEVLALALSTGAIDESATELTALADADLVVFAIPVGPMPDLLERAAPFISAEAIVTDVGSVKRAIVEAGERLYGCRFIGGHPMAGSEASGVGAARHNLFEQAPWALVRSRLLDEENDDAGARLRALISALGSRVVALTPDDHDHLVGLVSHLPHALSFAFARTVELDSHATAAVTMAGASYRDIRRVSNSSPELWADILIENRGDLAEILHAFGSELNRIGTALASGDREALLLLLRSDRPV